MARAVAFQAFEACFDLDLRGAVLPSMFHLSHVLERGIHDKGVYYYITLPCFPTLATLATFLCCLALKVRADDLLPAGLLQLVGSATEPPAALLDRS